MFNLLTGAYLAFISEWYDDEALELESIMDFDLWERLYDDLFVPLSEALDDSLDESLEVQILLSGARYPWEYPLTPGFTNIDGPAITGSIDLTVYIPYDVDFYVDELGPAFMNELNANLTQLVGSTINSVEQLIYPDEFKDGLDD